MKICSNCKVEKEDKEFNKKGNKLQNKCKQCNSEYLKKHYLSNIIYYKNKSKKSKDKYILDFIKYKKSLFCIDCNMSFEHQHWLCDFHHIDPNEKDFNIANIKGWGSLEWLKKEIDKCVPLCANCHRTRHYQQNCLMV